MIQRIRTEFYRLQFADIALTALAFVPYALGWLAGVMVRLALWTVAAVIAGYHAGKGEE